VLKLNLSLMQLKIFNPLLDWRKRVRSLIETVFTFAFRPF
jgi:hypothetical protein